MSGESCAMLSSDWLASGVEMTPQRLAAVPPKARVMARPGPLLSRSQTRATSSDKISLFGLFCWDISASSALQPRGIHRGAHLTTSTLYARPLLAPSRQQDFHCGTAPRETRKAWGQEGL